MAEVPTPRSTDAADLKLSASGQYAFAGLCAHILAELYSGDDDRKFRNKVMTELSFFIGLPQEAMAPHTAVADCEYKVTSEPLIDLLLDEDVVKEKPQALLSSFLMTAIKDGAYDARVRVFLDHMCWLLRVDFKSVEVIEEHILDVLRSHEELSEEEKKLAVKKARRKKIGRGIAIGLATVVGGTVVGLTGGLAAPLIASGVGALIGATGGAALASVAGVAVISSLFGAAGAGLTGYKMKKRVGGIEQFEFEVLTPGSQMSTTIAVSGWITSKGLEDFRTPWLTLDNSKEQYFLKYEGRYLQELGKSLDTLSSMAVSHAITETLKYTVLNTLISAVAWPSTLLGLASVIDNPWHVCTRRAENTGKQLAEVLVNREQGQRPVTLIGFSLGARVIFFCLRALAEHPRGAGIVENAYLLGAPVSGKVAEWKPFSKVVAGKVVNAYIRNDWILKFLYRTASAQLTIAGTGPVEWDDRRMINMDLTNVVSGHMDYMKKMTTVLEAVGIHTKRVTNVFNSSRDRSRSTSPPAPSVQQNGKPLMSPLKDEQEVEPLSDNEEVPLEKETQVASPFPYQKLQPALAGSLSEQYHISQEETTDSEKSLTEKLNYEQLIEEGSSQDCVPHRADLKPKHKVVKIAGTKVVGSERLLGDVRANERLLGDSSQDSVLSADHMNLLKIQEKTTPSTRNSHDIAEKEQTTRKLLKQDKADLN